MAVANCAEGRSEVVTWVIPPLEKACMSISSALNSVGWKITLIPLLSTHSVVAISSLRVTDFIFPLRGDFLTNWLSNTSSFGASIASCSCALSAASICCSEGSLTLSFSGAEIATVGLACINFAAI